MDNNINFQELQTYFKSIQTKIVTNLEDLDGKKFLKDNWEKSSNENLQGYGSTQILEEGNIFERAGVGFSCVQGNSLPKSASTERQHLSGCKFDAAGVSLVLHPFNPYIPTVHFNIRILIVHTPEKDVWWFGGGMDLTPYYGFEEDCKHFHQTCKNALEPFGSDIYPLFKKQCDDYFYLKHRNEARGIGGIFYDNFDKFGFEQSFNMTKSVADAFLKAYIPILEKRKNTEYGEKQRNFQAFRRGRYVEFNLIFDRGTLFGLQSGGRTESILLSMPPKVQWGYNYQPMPHSEESRLYSDFLPAKDWI
ncbi:MAG: hypothetical protein RLZZ210_464 [Pseudomonadota bacterium]|jgi:coproporphyrinogen III oxidase